MAWDVFVCRSSDRVVGHFECSSQVKVSLSGGAMKARALQLGEVNDSNRGGCSDALDSASCDALRDWVSGSATGREDGGLCAHDGGL
jgi:hypothetical protein